jgi:hypothetical protein
MLQFQGNTIVQNLHDTERIWTVEEVFNSFEPLSGESLAVRTQAIGQAIYLAEEVYQDLSPTAILHYQFWKLLQPRRIEERKFHYTIGRSDRQYAWELLVNQQGLWFTDLDGMYAPQAGQVFEQVLSDFWFYGPLMPMPHADDRKWTVVQFKNAFIQVGPVAQQHFTLLDYPSLSKTYHWSIPEKGTLNLHSFGLELEMQTSGHQFLSFERILHDTHAMNVLLGEEVVQAVQQILLKPIDPVTEPQDDAFGQMREAYFSNGGMRHYIQNEMGDAYKVDPLTELHWKRELLSQMQDKLRKLEHLSGLEYIATVMQYHGVPNIVELFQEAHKTAGAEAKLVIEKILREKLNMP